MNDLIFLTRFLHLTSMAECKRQLDINLELMMEYYGTDNFSDIDSNSNSNSNSDSDSGSDSDNNSGGKSVINTNSTNKSTHKITKHMKESRDYQKLESQLYFSDEE